MRVGVNQKLRGASHKLVLWVKIIVLVFAGIAPAVITGEVSAAQLQNRQVAVSTSEADQTGVDYDFEFDTQTSAEIDGIILQFCTTPLGTCTLPTGMDVSNDLLSLQSTSNFPESGTAFTEVTSNTGDCSDTGTASTVTMYCISRNSTTAGTATNATVNVDNITNPEITSPNLFTTVFVRVSIYSDNGFTTVNKIDDGTVAAAIVAQLQTAGRVQERLEFCVAAIDDWETGDPGDPVPDNCGAFPSTTNIDIGVIDNNGIAKSPVETTTTNGSNDRYGVAMVNTNASGGVTVGFFAEEASIVSGGDTDQLRAFRVSNADCSATASSETDQCFVAAIAGGEVFSAGTEAFGLQVPCIDSDPARASTSNLTVPDAYDNTDNDETHAAHCQKVDTESGTYPGADLGDAFAWNSSGSPDTIASSTSVVDDEIIKIRFGATAAPTTPTGTYIVTTTYVATATF